MPVERPTLASDQPVRSANLREIAYYVGSVNRVRRMDSTAPRPRLGLRAVAEELLPEGARLEKLVAKIMHKKGFAGTDGVERCVAFVEHEFLRGKWNDGDISMFE